MADWQLTSCCSHTQVAFIATIGAFIFVILALWRTPVLDPFKLITVFLHEASHATACKLTGGKVEGMEVKADEDLGSAFWGMVLVVASTNDITLRIAAGLLIAALVVVLIIAKNWFLRFLCIGFISFLVIIWILQELTVLRHVNLLRYTILFMGVMNCLFSVYDIYDDLISRRVNSSDAEKFADICPCPCNGVGWGVIWGFISFIFLLAAVYLGLVSLS